MGGGGRRGTGGAAGGGGGRPPGAAPTDATTSARATVRGEGAAGGGDRHTRPVKKRGRERGGSPRRRAHRHRRPALQRGGWGPRTSSAGLSSSGACRRTSRRLPRADNTSRRARRQDVTRHGNFACRVRIPRCWVGPLHWRGGDWGRLPGPHSGPRRGRPGGASRPRQRASRTQTRGPPPRARIHADRRVDAAVVARPVPRFGPSPMRCGVVGTRARVGAAGDRPPTGGPRAISRRCRLAGAPPFLSPRRPSEEGGGAGSGQHQPASTRPRRRQ